MGFARRQPEVMFVAYIDVLGFAPHVTRSFATARREYDLIIDHLGMMNSSGLFDVKIRMISDAFYLTSKNPTAIILTAHWVQHAALWCCNWLVRGAIALGRHQELNAEGSLFVVSEALTKAVKDEQSAKRPCIVLHPSALPSRIDFDAGVSNFQRSILYYDRRWIVNPFNPLWGYTPAERVKELRRKHPKYRSTYDWFLGLYDAVKSNRLLLPNRIKRQIHQTRKTEEERGSANQPPNRTR